MENASFQIRDYLKPGCHAHLVGIGGVSMRPLGLVLRSMGMQISGSDMNASVSTDELISKGIDVAIGHRAENIAGADCVIRTAAANNDNPEIAAARAAGIPIPMYQIGNVLTLGTLGKHHYNDSAFGAVKNLLGLSEEKNGLIYTSRGGFIDIAHVRDTADNTFYLFNRIAPTLGQAGRIFYSEELGVRRVQLNAFTPPAGVRQRYQLAAWLAGHLAFEIAQWHEIAQRYGFQSVPGFSEEISAFSPEDLYSNLLGARLAINVILSGHGGSLEDYNQALDAALKQVLTRLLVATRGETEAMFQQIDGDWWNSHRRVPDFWY